MLCTGILNCVIKYMKVDQELHLDHVVYFVC